MSVLILLILATAVHGISYLPFINITDVSHETFTGALDHAYSLSLPYDLPLGINETNDTAWISSNGLISFSGYYNWYYPSLFPHDYMIVAPYWDDVDMTIKGQGVYTALTSANGSDILTMVDQFLATNLSVQFTTTMAIVAQWNNVCPYGNNNCSTKESNSFQVVIVTDTIATYAIYTYKCGLLNWVNNYVAIGYSISYAFYDNHPLSITSNANDIACLNEPTTSWSNVVYKLTTKDLQFISLVDVPHTNFARDDDKVYPLSLPHSLPLGTDTISNIAWISSNGLVSFSGYYNFYLPSLFPHDYMIVAPYWDDIDMTIKGQGVYTALTSANGSDILTIVDQFLATNLSVQFTTTMAIVAQWNNVCPYGSNNYCFVNESNSFQVVIVTDTIVTYAIYTYKCGLLNWVNNYAAIGYSISHTFYDNHPLSTTSNANDIACLNEPTTSWSNVVYKLTKVYPKITSISADTVAMIFDDKLQLYCDGYGDPRPSITWHYNNTTITNATSKPTDTYTVHSVLELTNISMHHNGVYTCTVSNTLNTTSHDVTVTIQVPLSFIVSPDEVSVTESDDISMHYTIRGHPAPQITLIDGRNKSDIITVVTSDITTATLTIFNASRNDPEYYEISADNNMENISAVTMVIVLYPPSIINTSATSITANITDTVSFTCIVGSKPDATVDWYHDGIKMVYNNRVTLHSVSHSTSGDTLSHTLTIMEVSCIDAGHYTCNASNGIIHTSHTDSTVFTLIIDTSDTGTGDNGDGDAGCGATSDIGDISTSDIAATSSISNTVYPTPNNKSTATSGASSGVTTIVAYTTATASVVLCVIILAAVIAIVTVSIKRCKIGSRNANINADTIGGPNDACSNKIPMMNSFSGYDNKYENI